MEITQGVRGMDFNRMVKFSNILHTGFLAVLFVTLGGVLAVVLTTLGLAGNGNIAYASESNELKSLYSVK